VLRGRHSKSGVCQKISCCNGYVCSECTMLGWYRPFTWTVLVTDLSGEDTLSVCQFKSFTDLFGMMALCIMSMALQSIRIWKSFEL
jgi:hypothetical protein